MNVKFEDREVDYRDPEEGLKKVNKCFLIIEKCVDGCRSGIERVATEEDIAKYKGEYATYLSKEEDAAFDAYLKTKLPSLKEEFRQKGKGEKGSKMIELKEEFKEESPNEAK